MSDQLKQRPGDQPLPIKNDAPDIQSQVIADIEERRQVGIGRYGPFNGRDALRDLYEELLDGAMYIRQVMVERDSATVETRWAFRKPTGEEQILPTEAYGREYVADRDVVLLKKTTRTEVVVTDVISIYGLSDDTIVVSGVISEQFHVIDPGGYLAFSGGVVLHIAHDGLTWRITPIVVPNPDLVSITRTALDDSDKADLRTGCDWVVYGMAMAQHRH